MWVESVRRIVCGNQFPQYAKCRDWNKMNDECKSSGGQFTAKQPQNTNLGWTICMESFLFLRRNCEKMKESRGMIRQ